MLSHGTCFCYSRTEHGYATSPWNLLQPSLHHETACLQSAGMFRNWWCGVCCLFDDLGTLIFFYHFFFVVSASFLSFLVAMVCGGGSGLRLRLRLWFMLRASSYTFFSSIHDSWFILKVVVRSVWQWFVQFVLMFSSCLNFAIYFMIIII